MKHISHYHDWKRLHESEEEPNPDQGLEDLRSLVDLGFAEPHELKAYYKQNYAEPRRQEFLTSLIAMFTQVGVDPIDLTTSRQAKNGTYHFQLTPAQVERLLFGYPLPSGLPHRQAARMQRRLQELASVRGQMRKKKRVRTKDLNGRAWTSSKYEYWVYPGDVRNASFFGKPNSAPFVRFDGELAGEAMLARFIYQLALDSPTDERYYLLMDK